MRKIICVILPIFAVLICNGQEQKTESDRIEEKERIEEDKEKLRQEFRSKVKHKEREIKELKSELSSLRSIIRKNNPDSIKNHYEHLTSIYKDSIVLLNMSMHKITLRLNYIRDSLNILLEENKANERERRRIDSIVLHTEIRKRHNVSTELYKRSEEEFKRRIKDANDRHLNLLNEIENLQHSIISLNSKKKEMEDELNEKYKQIIALNERITLLESQLTSVNEKLNEKQDEYEDLWSEIDGLKATVFDLKNQVRSLSEKRSELRVPLLRFDMSLALDNSFNKSFTTKSPLHFGMAIKIGYYIDEKYRDNAGNVLFLGSSVFYVDSQMTVFKATQVRDYLFTKSELGFRFDKWFILSSGIAIVLTPKLEIHNIGSITSIGFDIPLTKNIAVPLKSSVVFFTDISHPLFNFETGVSVTFDYLYF